MYFCTVLSSFDFEQLERIFLQTFIKDFIFTYRYHLSHFLISFSHKCALDLHPTSWKVVMRSTIDYACLNIVNSLSP